MKNEVEIIKNEDMKGIEEDVDWKFVYIGEKKKFGIRK
jgi:hypothetical protein